MRNIFSFFQVEDANRDDEVDNETEFEDIETKLESIKGAYKNVLEFSNRKNQRVQKSREMRSRRDYRSRWSS